ncbi:MAG: ATP-dependent DNA helicase RecG [Elusimicrobia bacterium]|nr:ATP-dependent DNA helicase RecG [Elusimicrobiota bacterium]
MTSIQYLKGVGPGRAELFARLGIHTVDDLLFYFPKKWEDRRLNAKKENLDYVEDAGVIFGKVLSVRDLYTYGSLRIFKAVMDAGGYQAQASWFKRHSHSFDVFAALRKDIAPGAKIWLVGKPEDPLFKTMLRAEEYYRADDLPAQRKHVNRLVPVYGLTEGLTPKVMREAVFRAVIEKAGDTGEFIPGALMVKRGLIARDLAVKAVHFPENYFELKEARKRFIYEEFFLMALAWAIKRAQTRALDKGFTYEIKKHLLTPFREKLGFEFTASQKKAINEIFADMRARAPMARLLEGDVGSGKTVVALSALLLAVENGCQGVFMAPTEILAEQHFITFARFLAGLDIRFALLTSSVKPKEKKAIIDKLAGGELDIVIGTHAVLEENIRFKNLRLIVIDEQHRFGVRQRAALRQKGEKADMLIMTATPIPRTLFLALYGDLDLSVLSGMPPGRKPVKTESVTEEAALKIVRAEISKRRQAYIVYPVIEESEVKTLKSVKAEFERLKELFKDRRLAMLHGAMPGREKERVMSEFAGGKIDILVATPVVEVGIDVANAAVMVINNAENFGLASLHQLRGRVGRGRWASRCLLVAHDATADGAERIEAMCSTNSGFEISEKDIYLRGAGEVLGLRQHGEMEFRLADLSRDGELLRSAIEDREALLAADPGLRKPEHSPLRHKLLQLYQQKWNIIDLS